MEKESSTLIIDPSVLQNNKNTYSSLSDINHIAVFTNEFQKEIAQYQKNEKKSFNAIKKQVFVKSISNEDDIYKQVKGMLFVQDQNQILKESLDEKGNGNTYYYPIIGIAFTVFILFMIIYYTKRRERRKKNVHDFNDFY